jgi:hypothetical protein
MVHAHREDVMTMEWIDRLFGWGVVTAAFYSFNALMPWFLYSLWN